MKTRFTTLDVAAAVRELQKCVGMRVNNIYDIDNKTYLIRLQLPEQKSTILFEAGVRLHTTEYDWPKNQMPSGFSMKLRKHIKQKKLRLECVRQLGVDRVVDLQFGAAEPYEHHIIVELYDRGNVVLTDHTYTILNVLRRRTPTENQDVKLAVGEVYPVDSARQRGAVESREQLEEWLGSEQIKREDQVRRLLNMRYPYGSALLEHAFRSADIPLNTKVNAVDVDKLRAALELADEVFSQHLQQQSTTNGWQGFIVKQKQKRPNAETPEDDAMVYSNVDYHSYKFVQLQILDDDLLVTFPSFCRAVDEFYSQLETQKIDNKVIAQEKTALKKLENVRRDHEARVTALEKERDVQTWKAQLIELNQQLVDKAIVIVNNFVANQLDWSEIEALVSEATARGDPVASLIEKLDLGKNQMVLKLEDDDDVSEEEGDGENEKQKSLLVEIDLALNAYNNARWHYSQKKQAVHKQTKTLQASAKALKSAETKTNDLLKQVQVKANITKQRKVYWFEKFLWFISSENYLIIAGRDQQQNELVVKRHLRAGDVYVHADIKGAATVVVKNVPNGAAIPPKTLNEAGTFAICYSAAWDAKVVTSAWWVHPEQVSKTAPTGEYLTTGSFMIRGKKNYLAPSHLVIGFGFLFKLEDESVARHAGERAVRQTDEQMDNNNTAELDGLIENRREEIQEESEEEEGAFPNVKIATLPVFEQPVRRNVAAPEHQRPTDKPVEGAANNRQKQMTKRQRNKLKKIKEKYGDQDDEERELRLQLLGTKESKLVHADKKMAESVDEKEEEEVEVEDEDIAEDDAKIEDEEEVNEGPAEETIEEQPMIEEDEEEEEAEDTVQDDVTTILNTLTGQPHEDDILLFAMPVCAPYTTMLSYKYKVKLVPGTGKKGKIAKQSLHILQQDKTATKLEIDLLKCVTDTDLSRNIPGKVKLSTTQAKQKAKGKR